MFIKPSQYNISKYGPNGKASSDVKAGLGQTRSPDDVPVTSFASAIKDSKFRV
jgi:hypothetical protein